jgi:hypothetical protein
VSVKSEGESVRRTPVGAGRGLGPGGQVRRMFRGLRRRLRGNHERRVRHSVFTQLRRVSIPPRAPQLNCSSRRCAIGSHVRLHAPRSLNAPQRPSTLLNTSCQHSWHSSTPLTCSRLRAPTASTRAQRRSVRREMTPGGRRWCRTVRTRFPVRSSAAPCQLPPPHPPPPPPQDDDPPPQDEPPPHEEPPVEQAAPPPEFEPEPPAHQLCLDRRERLACCHPLRGTRVPRRSRRRTPPG